VLVETAEKKVAEATEETITLVKFIFYGNFADK